MRLAVDARVLVHQPTGVARYLAGILGEWPAFRRPGDTLDLYVDRPPAGPLPGEPDRVIVAGPRLPGGDPVWRQVALAARVRREAPGVLFCPFYSIPLAARVPAVVTVHDVSFAAHPEWFTPRARLAFRLVGPSARRAARVLTVSRFSAGEIAARLDVPPERIQVVAPGLEARWFATVLADERRAVRAFLGHDGPYVLHLGAVHVRRNVDRLAAAVAALAAQRPGLALVVAGPTIAPAPDLSAAAGCVVRKEWVPEELVRPLLAEAAVVAYLSEYEGFGLPALEALACGAPVAVLRRASLPEVLGDAGAYVEDARPGTIAAVLGRLLADAGARAELVARGAVRAREFDAHAAAGRVFSLLREVAA